MTRCILAIAAVLLCRPLWAQSVPLGEIIGADRTIRDPLYSWSARFPVDWVVDGVVRWGDRETTLYLGTLAVPSAFSTIYYKSYASPQPLPTDAEALLWEEAERHTDRRIRGGLTSYTPQAGSFVFKYIGGHPAVRFVAHFSSDDRTFCEYIVRVASERGVAQAMLRVPLVQFEAVREDFEAMADTLLLPRASTMAAPGGNGRAISAIAKPFNPVAHGTHGGHGNQTLVRVVRVFRGQSFRRRSRPKIPRHDTGQAQVSRAIDVTSAPGSARCASVRYTGRPPS